jgi:type VI secretion system secreted protein Hcp
MAQVDYFLKLDGIDGEAADDQFPKWIEVSSWSWGAVNTNTHGSGGAGAGKVSVHDLSVTAQISSASATISQYCVAGTHIAWAEIDCRKAGDTPQIFLKIKLTDVIVSAYNTGGTGHGDIVPTDRFTLNYAKIDTAYGAQNDKGKVNSLDKKMGYDLRTNKKS